MAGSRPSDVNRRRRRWSFAGCIFDEANWTLSVDGKRIPIETKPLEILRALLLRAGNVVSKEELLDAVWPDVEVVEASLTTAVRKLRGALGDDRRKVSIIETVQRIGYRLAAPVTVEELQGTPEPQIITVAPKSGSEAATAKPATGKRRRGATIRAIAAVAVLSVLAVGFLTFQDRPGPISSPKANYTTRDVISVMRRLDLEKVESMIAAGWQPDTPLDAQGDTALGVALSVCEWDPDHDRRKLQLMVRTLLDGGARLEYRNAFGDTAYSIAKAPRYCGPNHPVTRMIRTLCGQGLAHLGDRCMASYELARGKHFIPEPLRKG